MAGIGTKTCTKDRIFAVLSIRIASTSTFLGWFNLVETC